jgi:hypothetical protein
VPDLRGRAIHSTPQLTIEYDSTTNTGPKRDADDRVASDRCTLPHLTHRRRIGIVLEHRGDVKLFRQSRAEREPIETRKIWRLHYRTICNVHCARYDQRDRGYFINTSAFMNGRDDCVHDRICVVLLRRVLLEATPDFSFLIDCRGTQVRPAEIGGEDQAGFFFGVHFVRRISPQRRKGAKAKGRRKV